jgi:pimeloyl-ACP methyl ester carboxylesterase
MIPSSISRRARSTTSILLAGCVLGAVVAGCDEASETVSAPTAPAAASTPQDAATSAQDRIVVDGRSVRLACSGTPTEGRAAVVLLAGFGDPLERMAGLQEPLSRQGRVCSYDRLGEGSSDQPAGVQDVAANARILEAVIDRGAGEGPVVLAGHSIGGLLAARYAPEDPDRVRGLVLLDATSPTAIGDVTGLVPSTAPSPAADVRAQMVAINNGDNPERLRIDDGTVRPAGDIPVEVIAHGRRDLAAVPQYGPDLERVWSEGQQKWLAVSEQSRLTVADGSGHYIYEDRPDLAVDAVRRITDRASD